jgi:hypothetical protein
MEKAIQGLLETAFQVSKDLNLDKKFKDIKYINEDELYKNKFSLILKISKKIK